jgi:hypothetical protein
MSKPFYGNDQHRCAGFDSRLGALRAAQGGRRAPNVMFILGDKPEGGWWRD